MTNRAPVTVLYVAWAPFFSGAERALLLLVQHLDRAKYRPVVAVGTDGEMLANLKLGGTQAVHIPIAYTGARTMVPWFLSVSRLARTARSERAAIIHSNDVPSLQPAGYAGRIIGTPVITHVRFPDTRDGFGWFLKPGFKRALFVSKDLQTSAINAAPELFRDRSDVVYDGVLMTDLASDETRTQLRLELGLPLDRTVVALCGQVSEVKGVWEFIEAAKLLIDRRTPVYFAVLGDDLKGKGALRVEAERRVAEGGMTSNFRFLGFRRDAPRVIPAFDIVAVPSHVEPLGNATLEAMAAGVPVVGSRVGGIPEMVVDGVTGSLVPSRDAFSLANALDELVRDPARARDMGRAGRARAEETFSMRAHADRVQGIYDHLIGGVR